MTNGGFGNQYSAYYSLSEIKIQPPRTIPSITVCARSRGSLHAESPAFCPTACGLRVGVVPRCAGAAAGSRPPRTSPGCCARRGPPAAAAACWRASGRTRRRRTFGISSAPFASSTSQRRAAGRRDQLRGAVLDLLRVVFRLKVDSLACVASSRIRRH